MQTYPQYYPQMNNYGQQYNPQQPYMDKFQASQTAQNAYITASQDAQTAELIRRLGVDCPQPAYVVQPPQPVTFPNYNSCGCGCA